MPLKAHAKGACLHVKLTPKSSRNALTSLRSGPDNQQHIALRVTAVPEKGKANATMLKLLAKLTGHLLRSLVIQSGHTSRDKVVLVRGETEVIMTSLKNWLKDIPHG